MDVLDILKECAKSVYSNTNSIIGTLEGQKKYGIGAGGDISTEIDLVAERSILEILKKNGFNPSIVGEECGYIQGRDSGLIVMDGIDGTTNANCGLPFYCCSIAYSSSNNLSSVTDAVVFNLISGDLYSASKDRGSFVNQNKLQLSKVESKPLKDMVIGLNISGLSENHFLNISKLVSSLNHIRHLGANALELCYFASGSIDAYIDIRNKIRSIDMAACYLIGKEAGGMIFDIEGKDLDCDLSVNSKMSFIAVKNSQMFEWINNLIH